jgi:hypothetical protein
MGGRVISGDDDRFPAQEHEEPERKVDQERGKDESADIDALLSSPDGERGAKMTSKHSTSRGTRA